RNEKRMNSVVDPLGDELGEHHGRFSMYGGIAKKLFPRGFERRMNFKFVVGRDICCGGVDIANIRSVANFRHAVRARQLKVEHTRYPLAALFFNTQRHNSRTEEAPLDSAFNLHRWIGMKHLSKPGNISAWVISSTKFLGVSLADKFAISQFLQLLEGQFALFFFGEVELIMKDGIFHHLAKLPTIFSPPAK